MVIYPFAPYGLAHEPKTCQIWHKLVPGFAERRSLKPLDRFSQSKVLWTCLVPGSRFVVVHCHSNLPICPILALPMAQNLSNETALWPDFVEAMSLEALGGFIPFEVIWNCLDL